MRWATRWMVLHGKFLSYSKRKDEASSPISTLVLDTTSRVRPTEEHAPSGYRHEFVIESSEFVLYACAESTAERDDWVRSVQQVLDRLTRHIRLEQEDRAKRFEKQKMEDEIRFKEEQEKL